MAKEKELEEQQVQEPVPSPEAPEAAAAGAEAQLPDGEPSPEGGEGGEPAPAEEPKEPTARERYRSRYQDANPDLDLDDEDAFYGRANENLDELQGYRDNNEIIGKAIEKNPVLGGMLLAAREGINPYVYLAQNVGLDARMAADDPDFDQKVTEALKKYEEKKLATEKNQQDMDTNFQQTIKTLKEVGESREMSEEEISKAYTDFFQMADDASVGKVSKETWEMWFKAHDFDSAVEEAGKKARTQALNEKLENKLEKPEGELPDLGGGGAGRTKPVSKKKGGFASFGMD